MTENNGTGRFRYDGGVVYAPDGSVFTNTYHIGTSVCIADLVVHLNAAYAAGRASIPDPAALVAAMRQCVEAMELALGELSPLVMNGDRVRKCNTIRSALSAAKAAMGEA